MSDLRLPATHWSTPSPRQDHDDSHRTPTRRGALDLGAPLGQVGRLTAVKRPTALRGELPADDGLEGVRRRVRTNVQELSARSVDPDIAGLMANVADDGSPIVAVPKAPAAK